MLGYHFINDFSLVSNHTALDDFILEVKVKPLFFGFPKLLHEVVEVEATDAQ